MIVQLLCAFVVATAMASRTYPYTINHAADVRDVSIRFNNTDYYWDRDRNNLQCRFKEDYLAFTFPDPSLGGIGLFAVYEIFFNCSNPTDVCDEFKCRPSTRRDAVDTQSIKHLAWVWIAATTPPIAAMLLIVNQWISSKYTNDITIV